MAAELILGAFGLLPISLICFTTCSEYLISYREYSDEVRGAERTFVIRRKIFLREVRLLLGSIDVCKEDAEDMIKCDSHSLWLVRLSKMVGKMF